MTERTVCKLLRGDNVGPYRPFNIQNKTNCVIHERYSMEWLYKVHVEIRYFKVHVQFRCAISSCNSAESHTPFSRKHESRPTHDKRSQALRILLYKARKIASIYFGRYSQPLGTDLCVYASVRSVWYSLGGQPHRDVTSLRKDDRTIGPMFSSPIYPNVPGFFLIENGDY